MTLIFTKHLIERYKDRQFTADLLARIISEYDRVIQQSENTYKYIKIIDSYAHIVVAKEQDTDYILITYYKTSQISKYLK